MSRLRNHFRAGALLAAVAACVLAFVAVRTADVRAIYSGHVIATLELGGVRSAEEADKLRANLAEEAGVRTVELTHSPGDQTIWLARIQFHARSVVEARERIGSWLQSLGSGRSATLVRATRYRLRIARPTKGDVVIGPREEVTLLR